ncbi:MAG: type IV pilus biogenesis protein PilM [Actinomycetota bacterium]
MSRRIVGLEIGPESIRAVQIHHKFGGKLVVEKYGEVLGSHGVDANGRIVDVELLAKQIKSLWISTKFSSKHVALGVGGTDVFVREFSVPEMKQESLAAALPSLAEGNLPMPTTELMLDFYPARINANAEQRMVSGLLLAATKSATDALVAAVEQAGLKPQTIDLIPFALLRQLGASQADLDITAIVHASGGFLSVIVAAGSTPTFIRLVPLPLAKKTVQNQDEQKDESLDALENPSDGEIENPYSALQEVALRELRDTLAYYGKNHPEEPISRLFTSGKGLDNSEWLTLLGQKIWLPAESHVQGEYHHMVSKDKKNQKYAVPSEYLVPLALAKGVWRG